MRLRKQMSQIGLVLGGLLCAQPLTVALHAQAQEDPPTLAPSATLAGTATLTLTPTPTWSPPVYTTHGPRDPVLPTVSDTAREIYQRGLAQGNNPNAFSKIGDCNSASAFFLAAFDNPRSYRLGAEYAPLQPTIDQFAGSWSRDSLAAHNGFGTSAMFSPLKADRRQCQPGEGPLACELRLHKPSFAIISLGTNGAWQTDDEFEDGLRLVIEATIDAGTVPILSTKADDLEGGGRFNFIIARLAAEYDIPLWNFWLAASALPSFGLQETYHLRISPAHFDDPTTLRAGWGVRNLTALQALDNVLRGVTAPADVDTAMTALPSATPIGPTATPRPPAIRHRPHAGK
jgi:hypothetical protein